MSLKSLLQEYKDYAAKHNADVFIPKRFASLAEGERKLHQIQIDYPGQLKPVTKAMQMLYVIRVTKSLVTRKEYIAQCTAVGIKPSTAARQWTVDFNELERRVRSHNER